MNAEEFARAKAAFLEIADLAEADRERRLARIAAEDEAQAREIRRWLAEDRGPPRTEATGLWGSRLGSPASGAEGHRLGEFVLIRPLGSGGMGEVWEATQTSVQRKVALKLMRNDTRLSPSALRRFRREAEAAGRVEHPAIVKVIAAGEADGVPYIAQELVPGGRSLSHDFEPATAAAEGPPLGRLRRIAEIVATIAEGLQAAHERGVLHRDVKPSNILIGADERPRLCDFGVAHLEDSDAGTMSGALVGTPHYMSPELLDPRWGAVGPRADVFSLGVTLFECLTGRKPFEGASAHQVMRATLEAEPEDPRRRAGDIPADLAAICLKALEKPQDQRYVDAAAMAKDLRRWLGGQTVVARPIGALGRTWRWFRRHPAWGAALATLLLGLGVTTGLIVQLSRRQAEVSRLALTEELHRLREEASALWPVAAADEPRLAAWLDEAARLLAMEEGLQGLRRRSASENPPDAGGDMGAAWWNRTLGNLLAEIEEFRDPRSGLVEGSSLAHGPGIAVRLELARALRQLAESAEFRTAWEQAAAEIADPVRSPQYRGFVLAEQEALLPLRRDPRSGLWEFADLRTGDPPALDPASGSWRIEESTGMVFVLMPPIEFTMGAQQEDPGAPNYAEHARQHELGLIPLRLDPFLLSKYEMTQGQWLRQTGENPAYYAPQDAGAPPGERFHPFEVDLRHPIEHVGLRDIASVLRRLDMEPPTGAQWEAAMRAGFDGDYPPEEWLRTGANLFDMSATRATGNPVCEPWDDGYWLHAPVGSFAPNPCGLHDLFGNVSEFVRDPFTYELVELAPLQASGQASVAHPQTAIARGGYFSATRGNARASMRRSLTSTTAESSTGVRPVREIRL